jgi:hypothetical protein
MDQYAEILASFPGLKDRLENSGVRHWLKGQRQMEHEGKTYFILGGDRLASEAEAMLTFALEHHLISPADVQSASARQPLPPGVEAIDIDKPDGGK